jgi:Zn-dependent protease with chaperone function
LETLSFGTVLIPRVNAILADFLRVVLFPCTIMLGPWFGDAINNMSRVGLGEITQSGVACASRKLEIEADVISARLLALAGFDPGAAVSFWESRLSILPTDLDSSPPQPPSTSDPSDTSPSRFLKAPNSMRSTHPIDEKRVMMLEQELERWKKFKEKLLAKRQAAITS